MSYLNAGPQYKDIPDDKNSHKDAKCGVHQQGHACWQALRV